MANKTKISPLYSVYGNPFEIVYELAQEERCPFDKREYKRIRVRERENNTYIEIEHNKSQYCYISAVEYKYVLPHLAGLYWAYQKGLVKRKVIKDLIQTVLLMGEAEAKKNPKFREEFIEELKRILKELSQ